MPKSSGLQASSVLAAYAEVLATGRRVLVLGDALSNLGEALKERGARLVHVADIDPLRVAEASASNASRDISYGPLSEAGLALREGAFDLALIENLGAVGDILTALSHVRRALSPRGAAIVACPNPDARQRLFPRPHKAAISIDYYALYDAISGEFSHVRMFGQCPFVGYTLVDFAPEGEPRPALDSTYVPGGSEEPEWFVAVGSHARLELDEFAIVQLPLHSAIGEQKSSKDRDNIAALRRSEQTARERILLLTEELSKAKSLAQTDELIALRQKLERAEKWIAEVEARAAAADERADEMQTALLERAEPEADTLAPSPDPALDEELQRLKARLEERETELAAQRAELVARDTLLDELKLAEQSALSDLSDLEQRLSERAGEIRRLETELREAERVGRELILELSELRDEKPEPPPAEPAPQSAAPEADELRERLEVLSGLNAQREADLAAARWMIQTLEERLSSANAENGQQSPLSR